MTRTDPVRITINVEAHPERSDGEIDRAEWEAMTPAARRERLDAMVQEAIANAGGAGWWIEDPDDQAAAEA